MGCRREVYIDERLAFTLITAAHKLKLYFQGDKPLQRAMSIPEVTGRMALWTIELSELDIQYCPRTAIKGQVIADFIVEFIDVND